MRHRMVVGRLRHVRGWKRGSLDPRDFVLAAPAALALAGQVDLRHLGAKVEDQGDLGSCTCNSTGTVLELAMKRDGINQQLSRLWPYCQVRKLEGTPLSEDSGAEIRDVIKVFASMGCPSEESYPYDLNKWMLDPDNQPNAAALREEAAKHKALFYYRCPNLFTLKASLSQGFAVAFGFQVPENMMSEECARTGNVKFSKTEGFVGGHAVVAMGYDDASQQVLFLNSWSENWGDQGYGRLPYQFFDDGFADDFWTIRRGSK